MPEGPAFATRQLCDDDPVSSFTCGERELDEFFARHALKNARRGDGKTFVTMSSDGGVPRVLGFYTLRMAEMERATYLRLLPFPRRMFVPLATVKDAAGL